MLTETDILQLRVVNVWQNYSQALYISAINSSGIQSFIILHVKALPDYHKCVVNKTNNDKMI